MNNRIYLYVLVPALMVAGVAFAQYPIMDRVADGVVAKYRDASCEDLWKDRGKPKSPEEQEAIQLLHDDAKMRTAFINRVAAPIVNKLFECGLVP